jgi:hypothetical protein
MTSHLAAAKQNKQTNKQTKKEEEDAAWCLN